MDKVCGWEVTPCESCCAEAIDGLDPAVVTVLADMAAWVLWSATGKRFGLCEKVLRPCRRNCGSYWGGLSTPARIGGEWVNIPCGSCVGACGCSVLSEFIAPNTDSVLAVTIDGEELDPAQTLVVYDRRRLVRIDGDAWPACQNLAAADGEDGAWSVTVLQGEPIPPGGETMAGILLCELAKACTSDDSCRLPQRVQSVARQGVTFNFADVFSSLGEVRTGLFEVDLWIESARTTMGLGSSISSIDVPRASVQTWPTNEGSA